MCRFCRREAEKLFFGNIVKMDVVKSKTDEGYIRPVLVFGDNDKRSLFRDMVFAVDFKMIHTFTPAGNNHFQKTVEDIPAGGFRWDEGDFHA